MLPGMHLMCCEDVIENEIKQGLRRKDVALTYAMALRSEAAGRETDWKRINAAILTKWVKRGLTVVKNRAWDIAWVEIDPAKQ